MQAEFDELARRRGGQDAGFLFVFDEPLSHLVGRYRLTLPNPS